MSLKSGKLKIFIVFGLGLISALPPLISTSRFSRFSTAQASDPTQTPPQTQRLAEQIKIRRARVREFEWIRKNGTELGLRVWLFGGTAAGYAHYVNWDLKREAGDTRYIASRFDYDFTSIYRSTQDADLVVDGDPEKIEILESRIQSALTHLQGSKSDWEVRYLRRDRGDKVALLRNPDFLEQHSDSNSTGMIELTAPPSGESVVRDLRDWDTHTAPQFLRDVAEGRLHYYYSPRHTQTSRASEGLNPSIFSVIRYFTKAFQYELAMRPEDLERIRKVMTEFNPETDLAHPQTRARFEKIGKRLIMHASNIEYAWNQLEQIGLRQKLIKASNSDNEGSLAWWLNKEPLRTHAIGQGDGKTLGQILIDRGIDPSTATFSHETRDFLTWESISRDTTGRPNVVVSRKHTLGETASHGQGHYTLLGRAGARGTGFTVRYLADPMSREGKDFIVKGDEFIWNNRAALQVISDSVDIDVVRFFEMIVDGVHFDSNDRGILQRIKKRLSQRPITEEQIQAINLTVARLVRDEVWSSRELPPAILEWLSWPFSGEFVELMRRIMAHSNDLNRKQITSTILPLPHWQSKESLIDYAVELGGADQELIRYVITPDLWSRHPEWIDRILARGQSADRIVATLILTHPGSKRFPRWIETLITHPIAWPTLINEVLTLDHWLERHDLIDSLQSQIEAEPRGSVPLAAMNDLRSKICDRLLQAKQIVGHGI